MLAENPVSTLQETVAEAKDVRTGRGKLFLTLSVFIFAEGLGSWHIPLWRRGCVLHFPQLNCRVSYHNSSLLYSGSGMGVRWLVLCYRLKSKFEDIALDCKLPVHMGSVCQQAALQMTCFNGCAGPEWAVS